MQYFPIRRLVLRISVELVGKQNTNKYIFNLVSLTERIFFTFTASLIDGDIIDSKSAVGSPAFIHQFHFLTRNVCAVALQLHLAIIRSLLYVHVCISSTHNVCSVKLTQNSNRDEYFPAGRRATSIFLFVNIFQYF